MAKYLPGVPMSIGNTMNSNGFGPFGYALGRSGGQTCLYGWQSAGATRDQNAPGTPLLAAPGRSMSLRLRLCRAKASPAALVGIMQSLGPALGNSFSAGGGTGNDALAAASGLSGPGVAAMGLAPAPFGSSAAGSLPIAEEPEAPMTPRRRVARPAQPVVTEMPLAPAAAAVPGGAVPGVTVPVPAAVPPQPQAFTAPPTPAQAFAPMPVPA